MNYKKIPALLLFLSIAFSANAQQLKKDRIIPAWKISYHLDFGSKDLQDTLSKKDQEQTVLMEIAKSLSGSTDETPPLICYVSPGYIRVEQQGLGGGITIADKSDTVSFLLDSTAKTATKYPAAIPNLQTQMKGDSVVYISSDDFKMELQKDTMTIAGKLCRKAIFGNPGYPANVITVWYAPGMPHLYWQKYSYLKSIPGCVLSVGTVTKGLNVGIKAAVIEKVNLPKSFFLPPKDYKIIDGMF